MPVVLQLDDDANLAASELERLGQRRWTLARKLRREPTADVEPIDVTTFRVPGAAAGGAEAEVAVEGTLPYQSSSALCVLSDTDGTD